VAHQVGKGGRRRSFPRGWTFGRKGERRPMEGGGARHTAPGRGGTYQAPFEVREKKEAPTLVEMGISPMKTLKGGGLGTMTFVDLAICRGDGLMEGITGGGKDLKTVGNQGACGPRICKRGGKKMRTARRNSLKPSKGSKQMERVRVKETETLPYGRSGVQKRKDWLKYPQIKTGKPRQIAVKAKWAGLSKGLQAWTLEAPVCSVRINLKKGPVKRIQKTRIREGNQRWSDEKSRKSTVKPPATTLGGKEKAQGGKRGGGPGATGTP